MAGDWVPACKDLDEKPEFLRMLRMTGLDLEDQYYALMKFWGWADGHSEDGFFPGLTPADLLVICPQCVRKHADRCPPDVRIPSADCPAFFRAMSEVGWLMVEQGGVRVPRFGTFMGRSAKRRLNESRRKRDSRNKETGQFQSVREPSAGRPQACGQNAPHNTTQHNTGSNTPPPPPEGEERAGQGQEEGPDGGGERGPRGQTHAEIQGRGRELTACDRPDLEPAARKVLAHYKKAVATANPAKPWALSRVINLLAKGNTPDDLMNAATGYGQNCQRGGVSADRRQAAQTFYGDGGYCWEFMDWKPGDEPQAAAGSGGQKRDTFRERIDRAFDSKDG